MIKLKLRTLFIVLLIISYITVAGYTVYKASKPVYIVPIFFPSPDSTPEPDYDSWA